MHATYHRQLHEFTINCGRKEQLEGRALQAAAWPVLKCHTVTAAANAAQVSDSLSQNTSPDTG